MNLNALPGISTQSDTGLLPDTQLSLDESSLSSAFAQLLGARVLPADKSAGKLSPMALSAEDESAPLNRNQLTQLLAAFGERDGLIAPSLLSDSPQLASDTSEDLPSSQPSQDAALRPAGEIDAATLQALFAMLPMAAPPSAPDTAKLTIEGDPDATQPAALLTAALGQ